MEGPKPDYQQKKQSVTEQLTPTTAVAKRVGANKRARVNELEITMNDQGANRMNDIPFPFMKLPGGRCPGPSLLDLADE